MARPERIEALWRLGFFILIAGTFNGVALRPRRKEPGL
jgi:hypothetical protein